MTDSVRLPAVAGLFYPNSARELRSFLESFKPNSTFTLKSRLKACVLPHAGLMYCGDLIANAIPYIQASAPRTIIICGPSHHHPFDGASIYDGKGYQTPLGVVPMDQSACQSLKQECAFVQHVPQAHTREHCIEVILPFLQHYCDDSFQIVPMVTGTMGKLEWLGLAHWFKTQLSDDALVIASSDFSHFNDQSTALRMDTVGKDAIMTGDPNVLLDASNQKKTALCGYYSVLAMMAGLGPSHYHHLGYHTSADISGDYESVVGYHSIGVFEEGSSL